MRPLLVLVGPPGAGKTTVGQLVASRRGVAFRDTDADVERRAGSTISDIFIEQGEETFRELEREAVQQALTEHDGILALGGGAILAEPTRALLTGHRIVFLNVNLADAASRVGFNRDRPLLIANPRAQLRAMLVERRPLYEAVATATIETDGRTPEAVATDVEALL